MIKGNELFFARKNEEVDEIWLPVVGYEHLYEVSNLGNVKSLGRVVPYSDGRIRTYTGKLLNPSEKGKRENAEKGYLEVRLTDDNKISKNYVVHRLVATAFIPNPENKPTVNHIDGNKHNNNVDNLEWATYSENNQHAYDNNLKSDNVKVGKYDLNSNLISVYNSIHEAGRENNCNISNIHSVCNGKRRVAGGYIWKYMKDGIVGENQLIFARKNQNVILPTKRESDAGRDVYAFFEEESLTIPAHTTKLIPTGLYTAFSSDWVMVLKDRGSNGSIGLETTAGIIDSGFRNEIFVSLTNTNEKPVIISKDVDKTLKLDDVILYPYSKGIAQLLMLPVPKMETKEITVEELQAIESERGLGMLGSSNK